MILLTVAKVSPVLSKLGPYKLRINSALPVIEHSLQYLTSE
jgi:hypothetical protein